MKYYIIYYDSITQYSKTNKGYYVSYKNKIEDNYSENYILAKRYMSLGPVLNRIGIEYKHYSSVKNVKDIYVKIENSVKVNRLRKLFKINSNENNHNEVNLINILPNNLRIEIIEIEGNDIKNLGLVPNTEIYDLIKKGSYEYLKKYPEINTIPEKNATKEDIDDWCSHMDNVFKK